MDGSRHPARALHLRHYTTPSPQFSARRRWAVFGRKQWSNMWQDVVQEYVGWKIRRWRADERLECYPGEPDLESGGSCHPKYRRDFEGRSERWVDYWWTANSHARFQFNKKDDSWGQSGRWDCDGDYMFRLTWFFGVDDFLVIIASGQEKSPI